jgi:hypothetical protein
MEHEFERYDLRTLLELYLNESKEFSEALTGNRPWEELKVKRLRVKEISAWISKRYQEQYTSSHRRRDAPPHGD